MVSKAKSPEEYLLEVPADRLPFFEKLRQTVLENLPVGFAEEMSYGMIGYVVPKSIYPLGYHCDPKLPLPFVSIASQKNFVALYHMALRMDAETLEWLKNEWPKHSKKKFDGSKSCLQWQKMEEIPFDLIAQLLQKITVERWVELYEKAFRGR